MRRLVLKEDGPFLGELGLQRPGPSGCVDRRPVTKSVDQSPVTKYTGSDHEPLVASFRLTKAKPPKPNKNLTEIQLLTVSDWHAQLDPLFVFGQGSFGGAAQLSSYFDLERANNPNTLTFGNHNFGRGVGHLQDMIAMANATSGELGEPFKYLSANVVAPTPPA